MAIIRRHSADYVLIHDPSGVSPLMPVTRTRTPLGNVVLISLEPWDDVWRRNQHLAARLPVLGLADSVTFVNPARKSASAKYSPVPGVTVVSPRRRIPKRLGGHKVVATSLNLKVVRAVRHSLDQRSERGCEVGTPWPSHIRRDRRLAVHDVHVSRTMSPESLLRICSLPGHVPSSFVVKSFVAGGRHAMRVESSVVPNASDGAAIRSARPRELGVNGPHVGYVGTLHESRLDIDLVLQTAEALAGGRVHLVGPDNLTETGRSRLLIRESPSVGLCRLPRYRLGSSHSTF